ncbi:uncharacterized protein LOC143465056 isoform X1 [Clavelina lepadiformis]|uniref:uncharacterized protein LOC143465056 isoform X1 n=2 Tax=Clavelina lepadiformis TaxID=159417 RepID=UPI00404257DF
MTTSVTLAALSADLRRYYLAKPNITRTRHDGLKYTDRNLQTINERKKVVTQAKLQPRTPRRKRHKTKLSMTSTVMSPRSRSSSQMTPRKAIPEYDTRLDEHQQTYVLSPVMMNTLRKTMNSQKGRVFTEPTDKIGFHGPRRPLLLSYPVSPRHVGRAMFVKTYRRSQSVSPERVPSLLDSKTAKETIKLAYNMRTSESKDDNPSPKKLPRPKTVPPPQSRAERLAKEKGFILDGIALSSIQDDFGKIQPKLGPAIPPYNSHFDPYVKNYFTYKGLDETLHKTGQTRRNSESIQGKTVDRFHYVGVGHDYLSRRNKSGSGYSRDVVDGHDQFLQDPKPMNGYNGKFGFRRNTPLLRHCPSPFGTASRSSTF